MKELFVIFSCLMVGSVSLAQARDYAAVVSPTETFSQSIRSNPQAFFSFLNRFVVSHSEIKPYLEPKGWISGDSHPGQWTLVPNDGRFIYTLVDFDMAGQGSLFLDFMQYVLNVKAIAAQSPASDNKIRIKNMLSAYVAGLNGQGVSAPQWINKYTAMSESSVLDREQKYYGKKIEADGSLEIEKGFEKISDRSLQQEIVSAVQETPFFKDYNVRDVIQKQIERGGSAGQQRYWVLVQERFHSGIYRIFELKQKQTGILPKAESATAPMYQIFWSQEHPGYFDISIRNQKFEVRPKKIAIDDAEIPYKLKTDEQWKYLEDKALYDLNLLGKAQSTQPTAGALKNMIQENTDQVAGLVKEFSESYIKENKK